MMVLFMGNTRSTIFSPWGDTVVETLKSYSLFKMVAEKRPSWGSRCSAISIWAFILMLATRRPRDKGKDITEAITPSTRKAIFTVSLDG